jgi:hypothetical protein
MRKTVLIGLLSVCAAAIAGEDLPLAPNSLPWPIVGGGVHGTATLFKQHISADPASACHRGAASAANVMGSMPLNLGLDIAADADAEVIAIAAGVVRERGKYANGANYVVVESEQLIDERKNLHKKWTTLYANLADADLIAEGSSVGTNPPQRLGRVMGAVGNGNLTHLHLGMRAQAYSADEENRSAHSLSQCQGKLQDFVDPLRWLHKNDFLLIDNDAAQNTRLPDWETIKTSAGNPAAFQFGNNHEALASDQAISFTFNGVLANGGNYKVYARWPLAPDNGNHRETAAIYTMHQDGLQRVSAAINQAAANQAGRWVEVLDAIPLKAGKVAIELRSLSRQAGLKIVADAILLERQP